MYIYLIRHGAAKSDKTLGEPALTPEGEAAVGMMARRIASQDGFTEVRHSGKLRAAQTAEILARTLDPAPFVVEMTGLSPDSDVYAVAAVIEKLEVPVAIVSHLPFLDRLTALLVRHDPEDLVLRFDTAQAIRLEKSSDAWKIVWNSQAE